MKLYTTTDIAASIRKAHASFTHILFSRGYTLIKPVFFDTKKIADLSTFHHASWVKASTGQIERWRQAGGVLVVQDTHPKETMPNDVTVMVECPFDPERLELCTRDATEYAVIPNPVSWTTHEQCIDLRHPGADVLRGIWRACRGQRMLNSDIAMAVDLPVTWVQYMKHALKPHEEWDIHKRLAPERDQFVEAWDWVTEPSYSRAEVTKSGFRAQLEEMARFGYLAIKRYNQFPDAEPDWDRLARERETALTNLAEVRTRVSSLPDHLAT